MKTFEQRVHEESKGDRFAYDAVQRLTGVKMNVPEAELPNADTVEFEKSWNAQYDKVDNILNLVKTNDENTQQILTTIDTDQAKLNQYTTFDQWALTYDQNGNMTEKGGQRFTYDYRDQLVEATEDDTTLTFKYDPLGRRVRKTESWPNNNKTTNYFYSGNRVIEERDGDDLVQKQYVYGNGIDELEAIIVPDHENEVENFYYVHRNAIGSVTAITDANGDILERVTYDVFGMPTFTDGNGAQLMSSVIGNDILFQGRRYDKETNLYYYRARY
ncbi:MAG: hypothetical protein GY841_08275, partial [FCB group bacterium]|nr:hypothetical protein [FCB group bacterium]